MYLHLQKHLSRTSCYPAVFSVVTQRVATLKTAGSQTSSHGDLWGATDLAALSLQPCLLKDEVKRQALRMFIHAQTTLTCVFFTVVMMSPTGPMNCLILFLTALLVKWSLYEMPSSFLKHHISQFPCNFVRMSPSMSRFRRRILVLRQPGNT